MAKKVKQRKKPTPKTPIEIENAEKKKLALRLKRRQSRVITDITSHVQVYSHLYPNYENWYCGITKHKNAMVRIKQHMKQKNTPALYPIVRDALTMPNANLVEAYFSNLGMTNSPHKGGAKPESIYVYAFKRHPNFIESIVLLLS